MLLLTLLSSLVGYTAACGGFFCEPNQPVVQSGEAIVFGVDGQKVTMHILINYEGPAEAFAWLLPVMFEPTLETSSDALFLGMFAQTNPQFRFTVDENQSDSCNNDEVPECQFADGGDVPETSAGQEGDGVDVKKGSVGPFDYAIIKAQDKDLQAILGWLSDNEYDEYAGAAEIINHYVQSDHYFVALRLSKNSDTGDLVPIALEYEMPEGMDTIACIPLILTGVAAVDSMPINVYILGQDPVDPVNFFKIELDDTQVNWLGCQNNPGCFDQDYRSRSAAAFDLASDHAFIVEYSGTNRIMQDQISISVDQTLLGQSTTPLEFLTVLSDANVPSFGVLDNILNDFMKSDPTQENSLCDSPSSLFPWQLENCAGDWKKAGDFDATGLASEIQTRVIEPSVEAQNYVDGFGHLSSLYVQMQQKNMVKDPFFRFVNSNDIMPVVNNVHTAVGVPSCDADGDVTTMEITIDDGSIVTVDATYGCGVYFPRDLTPLFGDDNSPAKYLIVPAFSDQLERILERSGDGSFDRNAIEESAAMMDGRVMDQTIEPLPPTQTPSAAPLVSTMFASTVLILLTCFF
jgi:hypothetical protein